MSQEKKLLPNKNNARKEKQKARANKVIKKASKVIKKTHEKKMPGRGKKEPAKKTCRKTKGPHELRRVRVERCGWEGFLITMESIVCVAGRECNVCGREVRLRESESSTCI